MLQFSDEHAAAAVPGHLPHNIAAVDFYDSAGRGAISLGFLRKCVMQEFLKTFRGIQSLIQYSSSGQNENILISKFQF